MFGLSTLKLVGGGAALLLILATAFLAVRSYRDAIASNAALTAQVANLQATNKGLEAKQKAVADTVDADAAQTTKIIEHTNTIERRINAQPITTSCAQSPAITALLDGLRQDEQPTASDDGQPAQDAVPVPGRP